MTCHYFRYNSKKSNLLTSSGADGQVYFWNLKSQKLVHRIVEEDNQIFTIDYDPLNFTLATAGKDAKIRLYDYATKQLNMTLEGTLDGALGHSNRIFSLKYTDSNTIVSGGWDNTIFIWDVRQAKPAMHILGPNISGESLDVYNNTLLVGSYHSDNNLALYDLRTAERMHTYSWFDSDISTLPDTSPSCIYSAMFSKYAGEFILAGGTGKNEVRLFHHNQENENYKAIASVTGIESP